MAVLDHVGIFIVEVNGRRMSATRKGLISSFTFEERDKSADECTLAMVIPEGQRAEDVAPKRGDRLRVRWGYVGRLSDPIDMKVTAVRPSYGKDRTVQIVARDHGQGMTDHARQTVYENTELGEIVRQIAKRHGLRVDLPRRIDEQRAVFTRELVLQRSPSSPAEEKLLREKVTLPQANRTDRQLLHWIAHRTGHHLEIRGKTLRFLPLPVAAVPRHLFTYRHREGGLLSFKVTEHKGGKKQDKAARGVQAKGIDPFTLREFSAKATAETEKGRPVLGKESAFGGLLGDGIERLQGFVAVSSKAGGQAVDSFQSAVLGAAKTAGDLLDTVNPDIRGFARAALERTGATIATPGGRPAEAERNVKAAHKEAERAAVTASFEAIGDPSVRRHTVVEVRGVEKRDAGKWMVSDCRHQIDKGYLISGEVQRHGQNTVGKNRVRTSGRPNSANPLGPTDLEITALAVEDGKVVGVVQP